MELNKDQVNQRRLGHWLPADASVTERWVKNLMERAMKNKKPLDSTLVDFKNLVEGDKDLSRLASRMFSEVPDLPQFQTDPTGLNSVVKSFDDLLLALNEVLGSAPVWTDVANKVGLIGFPINAILDWPMATPAGSAFFIQYPPVNSCLKNILSKWGAYLQGEASTNVLYPPDGWLGPRALEALTAKGNQDGFRDRDHYSFAELYQCPDPNNTDTFGFDSWDAFFTRPFQEGRRPIAGADDDSVIIHACESEPLQFPAFDVKLSDDFKGKNQAYSLKNMLHSDPLAEQFADGTVYQAFLSALTYHRWHSPVTGRIVKVCHVPGTYYAENFYQGFGLAGENFANADPAAPNNSQPFIASLATRALVFIRSNNPDIGLMCFIAVGMAEVSSCEVDVVEGQKVSKGEQLGMFHFGGSSCCLVFGPKARLEFVDLPPKGDEKWNSMGNYRVNSALARVFRAEKQ